MISEELRVVVRAEAAQAIRELQNVQKATTGGTTAFKDMAKALIGFGGTTAALLAFKKVVVDSIVSGVQYAAAIEKQTIAFEIMLKSAGRARDLMKDIQAFSAKTPFQLPELTSAAQRLMAFGTAAENVVETMSRLGDLSMGNSATLDRLTLAYGKLQAKGKATLEELNMFTEAGVPLMQALADQTGRTSAELFDMISKGEIGFDEVNRAISTMTSEGGQFFNMTQRQAETLDGKMSTFRDNLSLLKAAMADSLVNPLKDALDWMTKLVAKMTEGANRANMAASFRENLEITETRGFSRMPTDERVRIIQDTIAGYEANKAIMEASGMDASILENKYGSTIERLAAVLAELATQLANRPATPAAPVGGAPGPQGIIGSGSALQWAMDNEWYMQGRERMARLGTGNWSISPEAYGREMSGMFPSQGPASAATAAMLTQQLYGARAGVSPAMNMLLDPTSTMFQGYGGGYFPYGADAQTTMQLMMAQVIGRNKNPLGYGSKAGTPQAFNAVAAGMGIGERGMGLGAFGDEGFTDPTVAAGIDAITRAFDAQADSVFTLDKALAEMEGTLQSLSLQAVTDAAYEFGKALGNGESLALSAATAMASFWRTIIDSLPQMLLAGAANAAAAGDWPLAAGLLAASAAAAVVSGSLAGAESRTPAAATSSAPVINIYGDVNDADRFESKVINVVRSMGSPA